MTGSYPILSAMSDPVGVAKLLSLFGIAVPGFLDRDLDFINPVDRCERFFNDSTQQLRQAIKDAGDARITAVQDNFVQPLFHNLTD